MKIANLNGRAMVVLNGQLIDIERASGGSLPSDPMEILTRLNEVAKLDLANAKGVPLDGNRLGHRCHARARFSRRPGITATMSRKPALKIQANPIYLPSCRVR